MTRGYQDSAPDHGNTELPAYDVHETESQARPERRLTKKARAALELQRDCNHALDRIKKNSLIANSPWADTLAAAPSAISTMAILFKIADRDEAKGLVVDSLDVMFVNESTKTDTKKADPESSDQNSWNEENSPVDVADTASIVQAKPFGEIRGTRVAGRLPSKYFHTNLQHCSDIGRLCFQDAQYSMNDIGRIARNLISETGGIATIIELLEEPEEAKLYLKHEMQKVRSSTEKCLEKAESIASQFGYWHLVIMHLANCSLNASGVVADKQKVVTAKNVRAHQAKLDHESERDRLLAEAAAIENELSRSEHEVDHFRFQLDMIINQPPPSEPYILDEMERVRRMMPNHNVHYKSRGFFTGVKNLVAGQSDKHFEEDNQVRKAAEAYDNDLRQKALEQIQASRNHNRRQIQDRLDNARSRETEAREQLRKIRKERKRIAAELELAKSNVKQSEIYLTQLSAEKLEHSTIMKILDNSRQGLGEIKGQLEPLVDFFKAMRSEVNENLDIHLNNFLDPIKLRLSASEEEENETYQLGRIGKRNMMLSAIQMQGRFSAIADISDAYVKVSHQYIRPTIRRMEQLSTLKEPEWSEERKRFIDECKKAETEINILAKQTIQTSMKNIDQTVKAVQRRAIEAAEY